VTFGNRCSAVLLCAALSIAFFGSGGRASAQGASSTGTGSATTTASDSKHEVKAVPKGTVGLGLIGAELGFVIPTVCGLDETWSLIVFPIVGAGGGAALGYFLLDKGDGHPKAAIAMLATGLALVIPAAVITLWATAYSPEDEPGTKPAQVSVKVARAEQPSVQQMARVAGPGLLRWSPDGLFLGAPAVTTTLASNSTQATPGLALQPHTELHVAMVSGRF
jgi:hypothetical protein